ncbi:ribonuclease H-like domain-containing protein [Natronomonas gomsonensis]|uniref:ribonuclease H-like domain-containing protein n=1 Tax=Natronomonas gomsonensis TaxID=1046043 RepID=UPI0020CA3C23|nr:ribonuclease H-like domain-containing protein [Natronomonas gomsonensis]MCY4730032.1 ribonuclease H-like domain-containing protein [Natronomonas gomsonensis]
MTELSTVAFDIETTGFETRDQLTVVGFDSAVASRVFLNTDGTTPSPTLTDQLNEKLQTAVQLTSHDSKRELLTELTTFVTSTLTQRNAKLVAYNGERWNGGFDLPFLRTRLCTHSLEWPFGTLPYVDVMDVFEKRFNTSENTLNGVYGELIGAGMNELDPFADSSEAVTAWEESTFEPLITHNVADIRRTRALMDLAERYCSKSDFSMKSLEPVV